MSSGYGVDVILVDPNIVGGLSEIKTKLQEIVASADGNLNPAKDHVLFNWRNPMISGEHVPIVTMRIGTAQYADMIYGRRVKSNEYGKFIIYPFSLHVWNAKFEYEMQFGDESKPTTNLADKIINKLERFTGDQASSGICYFYGITGRESQPERGPQNLNRVIVEGFMLAKRIL